MWLEPSTLRVLLVHERFGPCGGAESNLLSIAGELSRRGHRIGLVHEPSAGNPGAIWEETFYISRWEALFTRVTEEAHAGVLS